MSFILQITIKVINRRLAHGEKLEDILKEYPKLSSKEIKIIEKAV